MPHYIKKTLQRLQNIQKVYPQYSPHHYASIQFSKQPDWQYATKEDDNPYLLAKETKYIQHVVGIFYTMLGQLIAQYFQLFHKLHNRNHNLPL